MTRYLFALLLLIPGAAIAAADLTVGYLRQQLEGLSDDTPIRIEVEGDTVRIVPLAVPPPLPTESQAVLDLRAFMSDGGLAFALWPIESWTTRQTDWILNDGYPIVPSIHVKGVSWMSLPKSILSLTEETSIDPATGEPKPLPVIWKHMLAAVQTNKLPLCLRLDNLAGWSIHPDYDDAAVIAQHGTILASPRRVYRGIGDALTSFKNNSDYTGGTVYWDEHAKKWASHDFMKTLYGIVPDVAWLEIRENNEHPLTTPYGALAFPPAARKWLPEEEMRKVNERLANNLAANNWPTFEQHLPDFYDAQKAQYETYWAGLKATFPDIPAWKDFYTSAYKADGPVITKPVPPGYANILGEDDRYDASSSEYYVRPAQSDLTSLYVVQDQLDVTFRARDYRRQTRAKAFTSISVSVTPKTCYLAAQAGKHEVIDPAMFEQWMQWLAWTAHDGGPVQIVWWDSSGVKPDGLFFDNATVQAAITNLGRTDLLGITNDSYAVATMKGLKQILTNATTREHWFNGENMKLKHAAEPVKLWVSGNRLGTHVLLFAWSPVKEPPSLEMNIDTDGDGETEAYTVPGPGYWLASIQDGIQPLSGAQK